MDKYSHCKLLVVIVNKGMGSDVVTLCKKSGAVGCTILQGRGTAKTHILEMLGIAEVAREVVLSMIMEDRIDEAIDLVNTKLHLNKPGHGVSFVLPLKESSGLSCLFKLASSYEQECNPSAKGE